MESFYNIFIVLLYFYDICRLNKVILNIMKEEIDIFNCKINNCSTIECSNILNLYSKIISINKCQIYCLS